MRKNNKMPVNNYKNECNISTFSSPAIFQDNEETRIRVYKIRFWMLFLFSFLNLLCGMLYTQYASMADLNMCYYGVTEEAVNWTCMMFLIVYIIFVLPVSFFMDYMGLRLTVMAAAFLNSLACAMQFATLNRNNFPFVLGSEFVGSVATVFVLGIPPYLAATWFPSNELSRACAMGVFGNQLGIALGFIFSPLLVSSDCSKVDLIQSGKRNVAYSLTAVNAFLFILIIFTFQNKPPHPPSIAQVEKRNVALASFMKTVKSMMKNSNFILIFVVYGLLVGSYFALATILNDLILRYFPSKQLEIGWMGTLYIVSGLVGSILAGYVLDYTHKFKATTMSICIMSLITYIIFSFLLHINKLWLQFVTFGVLGFFMTSFLPVGFEYGIEVTFPESEVVSASLLNFSSMVFGIILTEIVSHILDSKGPIWSNAALGVTLLLCCIISGFITTDYKRSKKSEVAISSLKSLDTAIPIGLR